MSFCPGGRCRNCHANDPDADCSLCRDPRRLTKTGYRQPSGDGRGLLPAGDAAICPPARTTPWLGFDHNGACELDRVRSAGLAAEVGSWLQGGGEITLTGFKRSPQVSPALGYEEASLRYWCRPAAEKHYE